MATPGTAVPGAVVASGSSVSPGGAQGIQGIAGVQGTTSTTTNVSGFTVPAIGATIDVPVNDVSWMVLGEMICIAGAGGSNQAGMLQVTAILSKTVTLLNPPPAPTIPPADTSQSGLLKQLSGSALDYVGGDNACHPVPSAVGFISKSANYGLTSADSGKYVFCSGGSWQLTLPTPATGLTYRVRNDSGITGTTGTITVQPTSGTIDGLASIQLLPGQDCQIITDGTNWRSFGLKREVIFSQDISAATPSSTILLPAGFRVFEFDFTGIIGTPADAWMDFQLSTNGGATWIAANYYHGFLYNSTISAAAYYNQNNTTQSHILAFTASAGVSYAMAKLTLYPGKAGENPNWLVDSGYWYAGGGFNQKYNLWGFLDQQGLINAFKYFTSGAGNIINLHLTLKARV
jgi:hypothetical protein